MRLKLGVVLFFLALINIYVSAQDEWTASEDGTEYNCAIVADLVAALEAEDSDAVADLQNEIIVRDEDTEWSISSYTGALALELLANSETVTIDAILSAATLVCNGEDEDTADAETTAPSGDTFNVVVNGNVNVRSCAGTECDVVGQALDGSLLTVLSTDGDWYEVEFEGSTAFIASWLVTRGPDQVIEVDEGYRNEELGCVVVFDISRGDMDMNIIIAGDERENIFVDLYRHNFIYTLMVEGQLDKTFIDTGEPYIHQYYNWGLFWPLGIYQLEFTINDETVRLAWELEERGDYNIFVVCN